MDKSEKSWMGALATALSAIAFVISVWFTNDQHEFAQRVGGNELASNLQWLGIAVALLAAAGTLLGAKAWGIFDWMRDPAPPEPDRRRSVRLSVSVPTTPVVDRPGEPSKWVAYVGLQDENHRRIWTTPECATQDEAKKMAYDWRHRYENREILNRSELADL